MAGAQPLAIAAAAVFVATFALLAAGRVGRRRLPRGAIALAGGLATMALARVPLAAIDADVLLLLAGLMLLAGLAARAGLFAGLRRHLARQPPWRSLWLSCLVVAATSAVLLNDAAVVILVPFLWPLLAAQGVRPAAGLTLLAVAANVGSLLTPFGNPQNAVLAGMADLGVADFLRVQGPLVVAGFAAMGVAAFLHARQARPAGALPEPAHAEGRAVVLVAIGAFVLAAALGLPLGWSAAAVAVVALAALAVAAPPGVPRGVHASALARTALRHVDLNVLALFAGLYLLTGGIGSWLDPRSVPVADLGPAQATLAVTVASNAIGNVPAILLLGGLDAAWTVAHAAFLVSVSTLGGALLLTGSAASLLVAEEARKLGLELRFLPFLAVAVPVALPLLLLAAWWTW